MLVDSHCHLDFPEFAGEVDEILARAEAVGVERFLSISTKRATIPAILDLVTRDSRIFASIGIHPHEADAHSDLTLDELCRLATHRRVIGIGESGLDFYYNHSSREGQEHIFRLHCAAARKLDLPLILHTRDAEDDTKRILIDEQGKGAFPVLFHCFSGSADLADFAKENGFYISLSGVITFKKADALRDAVKRVSPERILVETDAPFLAPVPHRGQRNEPAYVRHTAEFAAALFDHDYESFAAQTTKNFFRLFSRATL